MKNKKLLPIITGCFMFLIAGIAGAAFLLWNILLFKGQKNNDLKKFHSMIDEIAE